MKFNAAAVVSTLSSFLAEQFGARYRVRLALFEIRHDLASSNVTFRQFGPRHYVLGGEWSTKQAARDFVSTILQGCVDDRSWTKIYQELLDTAQATMPTICNMDGVQWVEIIGSDGTLVDLGELAFTRTSPIMIWYGSSCVLARNALTDLHDQQKGRLDARQLVDSPLLSVNKVAPIGGAVSRIPTHSPCIANPWGDKATWPTPIRHNSVEGWRMLAERLRELSKATASSSRL